MNPLLTLILLSILTIGTSSYGQDTQVDSLNEAAYQLRKENPRLAIELAQKALMLARDQSNLIAESDALNRLAYANRSLQKFELTDSFFNASLIIRRNLKDPEPIARALNALAHFHLDRGNLPLAMKFVLEAEDMIPKNISTGTAGNIYMHKGIIQVRLKEWEEAETSFEKSLSIFTETQNKDGLVSILINIGAIYYEKNNFKNSLFYWQKADSILRDQHDIELRFTVLNNMALAESGLGNLDKAKDHYQSAIGIATQLQKPELAIEAYANYSWTLFDLGFPQKAIDTLTYALTLSQETQQKELEKQIYQQFTYLYEDMGNFEKAYEMQGKYQLLSDTILNTEKTKIIAELKTAQKEKKIQSQSISLQQKDNRILQLGLFALLLIILAAGIAIVSYYLRRKQIKKYEGRVDTLMDENSYRILRVMQTSQEEERKRIAMELHDHLGSTLSSVSQRFSMVKNNLDIKMQQFDKGLDLLGDAIKKVRVLSREMFSGVLRHVGFVAAIEDLAESIQQDYTLPIQVKSHGMESETLEISIRYDLFRIVEALLNNILKHAQARSVEITITRRNGQLNLIVVDDGIGFTPSDNVNREGIGLKSLEVRVRRLGGEHHIDSQKGKGTRISVTIPIPQPSETVSSTATQHEY